MTVALLLVVGRLSLRLETPLEVFHPALDLLAHAVPVDFFE